MFNSSWGLLTDYLSPSFHVMLKLLTSYMPETMRHTGMKCMDRLLNDLLLVSE